MIKLKTAKKLKNAGLIWEPKNGDYFAVTDEEKELREQGEIASTNIYVISGEKHLVKELGGRMVFFDGHLCARDGGCRTNSTACYCMNKTGYNPDINVFSVASWDKKLWLPRLDQMLAEIEKRNYRYEIISKYKKYTLLLYGWDDGVAEIDFGDGWYPITDFHNNDSPDEAAAQALLWILEQEK